MKTEHKSIPVAGLVEDLSIYPRHEVDEANVARLVCALEAGNSLPPVVAEKKSKRIVDGWHRCRAYRRVFGDEHVIDVELRDYPDEASLVFDSIEMNARHGRQLNGTDRIRSAVMLEQLGFGADQIAVALHVTEAQVQKLVVRVAKARTASVETVPGTRLVALKRPVSWMQGKTLTAEQVKTHDMLPGTSFTLLAKQLLEALRSQMVDLTDDRLMVVLRDLRDALNDAVT
jgi:hypothetical protein